MVDNNFTIKSTDLKDFCGVFGCISTTLYTSNLNIAEIIRQGLLALQHRGQESFGIATSKGEIRGIKDIRKSGLVSPAFTSEDITRLKGNLGIGHVKYTSTRETSQDNIQPIIVYGRHGQVAFAHNGHLVNAAQLMEEFFEDPMQYKETDSELMVQILCMPPTEPSDETNGPDWPARIRSLMRRTIASYSFLVMNGDKIYAVRDVFGNRPLCIGKLVPPKKTQAVTDDGCEGYVVSSESCAFFSVAAKLVREVEPGEILEISRDGFRSLCVMPRPEGSTKPAFCIFEYVYFARPDSEFDGQKVHAARRECGKLLAKQAPVDADLVSCVPESATYAALGFSSESGIPYDKVLDQKTKERAFIQPTFSLMQEVVRNKFAPLGSKIKGKKIILVDDSIVRGNTIAALIKMLREAGAAEVHLRIASPPLRHPCYMGINIPTKEELIANKYRNEELETELARDIGADSLAYLSVDSLKNAIMAKSEANGKPIGLCAACLTGDYPIELEW